MKGKNKRKIIFKIIKLIREICVLVAFLRIMGIAGQMDYANYMNEPSLYTEVAMFKDVIIVLILLLPQIVHKKIKFKRKLSTSF